MDALFDQEELIFVPRDGTFDVDRLSQRILEIGYSFRDEIDPAVFMVCMDEESREYSCKGRQEAPEEGFPYVLIIRVEPEQVMVNQFAGPEFLDYSREFVTWLVENFPCRVRNESGQDLTDELPS